MSRFRDPVARDKAWGRYYAARGLRPLSKDVCQPYNALRLLAYLTRRAVATEMRP